MLGLVIITYIKGFVNRLLVKITMKNRKIERFFKFIFLHIKISLPVIIYIYDIEK